MPPFPRYAIPSLKNAAKQTKGMLRASPQLDEAIQSYLKTQDTQNLRKKVMKMAKELELVKQASRHLEMIDGPESVKDFLESNERPKRWKLTTKGEEGDERYKDDLTLAYVATRMPGIYCSVHRVLSEIKCRLPDFQPKQILDFGSGPGTVLWALRDVWPDTITNVNQVEPSHSMSYASRNILQGVSGLPPIHCYENIQALSRKIKKSERNHDLVVASYVLGEVSSIKDRITIARQLWNLTEDILVIVEPGTPEGSRTVREIRTHILSMEKRKCFKLERAKKGQSNSDESETPESTSKLNGAFVIAPCSHDGVCPLSGGQTYCHFVQRLERTLSQRVYKRTGGEPVRGYEDEKFSFVVLRRGQRPNRTSWPLDNIRLKKFKEIRMDRMNEQRVQEVEYQLAEDAVDITEDILGTDYPPSDKVTESDLDTESDPKEQLTKDSLDIEIHEQERDKCKLIDGDASETEKKDQTIADLGGGWGRILFSPMKRGKHVVMDVCCAATRDASEGRMERVIVTKAKDPALHEQARKSQWGDLWPF